MVKPKPKKTEREKQEEEQEEIQQGLGTEADRLAQVQEMLHGDKLPPEQVNYDTGFDGAEQNCGKCVHYEMPGRNRSTCTQVAGEVQATGLCDIFEPSMDGQDPLGTAAEGMMNGEVDNPLAGL